MAILRSVITPHPPIIIPAVGGEETLKVAATIQALQELAMEIKDLDPEVVIIISPHGTVFRDAIAVTSSVQLFGNLEQFEAAEVNFAYQNDSQLVREIIAKAESSLINVVALDEKTAARYQVTTRLDHGMMVPLHFLKQAGASFRLVPIAIGFLPNEELYRFGTCIRDAVESLGRRAVIVASGDLSHRLTTQAPAGFNPRGREFDNYLVELIANGDVKGILAMDEELQEAAGECGLRSFIIMLGAMDGQLLETRILSYEGPFGVGYLVADVWPVGSDPARNLADELFRDRQQSMAGLRAEESVPVALARKTLETYLTTGQVIAPPEVLDDLLRQQAGVFVSLKKHGQLRGCIGTIGPTRENVAEEIIQNAISAGTRDPRFPAVTRQEMDELVYSVDILYPPEAISTMDQLNPIKYGVIVRSGHKSGLLLPNLAGIGSSEEQVAIAKRKAGISLDEPVQMERFEVVRYT